MTSSIVNALATPRMPALFKAPPICIVARVSPAFGKMNAHQFSVNVMRRIPVATAMVEMQKNQKAKRMMKRPERMPRSLTRSPSGSDRSVNWPFGTTLGACVASEMRPAAVYPAGPTDTYMPGRVGGDGNSPVMRRCVYSEYMRSATTHASPWKATAPTPKSPVSKRYRNMPFYKATLTHIPPMAWGLRLNHCPRQGPYHQKRIDGKDPRRNRVVHIELDALEKDIVLRHAYHEHYCAVRPVAYLERLHKPGSRGGDTVRLCAVEDQRDGHPVGAEEEALHGMQQRGYKFGGNEDKAGCN